MSRITSKLQVTIPRAIADHHHIRPGDEISWETAGEVIRVIPRGKQLTPEDRESRLRLFDEATERHRKRPAPQPSRSGGRGWTREGLYSRVRTR